MFGSTPEITYEMYQVLDKPFFAPPAWLFGPVWSILYPIIFLSFGYVIYLAYTNKIPKAVALPFALNLIANLVFTPLQFGIQSYLLASVDIVLVLVTLIWAMAAIYPHKKWLAYIQAPYLVWVSFATILQLSITYLNM